MPWGIPYRGQPRPKYPRPRRQVRDLAGERLQYTFTTVVFIIFAFMVLAGGLWIFLLEKDGFILYFNKVSKKDACR